MSNQFIGEIRPVGFNFAPIDWALCNGQLLSIAEYAALYSLIGTTYGGDGITTFALPDLQSRVPVDMDNSTFILGKAAGEEGVTLNSSQLPSHSHPLMASLNTGSQRNPTGNVPATLGTAGASAYIQQQATTPLAPQSISAASGGGQPHENRQPYLTINFIIALYGIYPSRS